jgi:hypothetical protein
MTEAIDVTRLIASMGWSSRPSGNGDNLAIETCPICGRDGWKFFISVEEEKAGLWTCMRCGQSGNLYKLRKELGLSFEQTDEVASIKDAASARSAPAPLPNFDVLHRQLMEDERFGDVLDHLVGDRQYSIDTLTQRKIGAAYCKSHKTGEAVPCFFIPYFDKAGTPVYYKARTIPPHKKEFFSPSGRPAPLYNGTVLRADMEELTIVEGESDCLTMLTQGFSDTVGVPGATVKKADWIEKLDELKPKRIYLLYDSDRVGQDNAREMASRIGLDRCWNICLPEFGGKDITDWFTTGRTMEEFLDAKSTAKQFGVSGVVSVVDALEQLARTIEDRGTEPKYKSPWPSLNKILGGADDGDLVGIMAEAKIGKTSLVLDWMHWLAAECGEQGFLDCLEMPVEKIVRKWVSHVTGTDDTPGRSKLTVKTVKEDSMQIASGMKADLLFGYHKTNKAKDVFETIYQVHRRYGVKVVGFDNLQILSRSLEHSAQEISRLTKDFKQLAMELNILLLLIIQPKKLEEGKIVSANDGSGSGAISKDVDAMICLHRNRLLGGMREKDFRGFAQTEETFEPYMLTKVDLARYAPGGACTLIMDGATSTVREMVEDEAKAGAGPGGLIPQEELVEA